MQYPILHHIIKKIGDFCITENQKQEIKKKYHNKDFFKVKIDSSFKKKEGKCIMVSYLLKAKLIRKF